VIWLAKNQVVGVIPRCYLHELICLIACFTLEFSRLCYFEQRFLNYTCFPKILIFIFNLAWLLLKHILYWILAEGILLENWLFLLMLKFNFSLLLVKQVKSCCVLVTKVINLLAGYFWKNGVDRGVAWRKLCCVLTIRANLQPSLHWFGRCANLLSRFLNAVGHGHLYRILF
jgi:hypothetical protein